MNLFALRHTLRRLARNPAFSATSVLLLGLAFGALACLFSVVYGLLYKPLPYPQSDRLVTVESHIPGVPYDAGLSAPLREEIAHSAHTIEGIAAYRTGNMIQRDDDGSRMGSLKTMLVEPKVFDLLGVRPALGRLFTDTDVAVGAARSVMLTWDEWQTRYGGDENAIGRTLRLNDKDYHVIGVLPERFQFASTETRLWLPLGFTAEERARTQAGNFSGTLAIARLRGDGGLAAASDELTHIARAMPELNGAFGDSFKLRVEPVRSLWVGERRDALLLMLLAASMVWLVTAANVTNLFLVRALERRHETALAAVLGATPLQRALTAVTEAAALCTAGVALGCTLLPAGLELLRHFDLLPTSTPQAIGIDAPTIALLLALSFLLCVVLAFAGLSVQRGNLHDMIRGGSSRQTAGSAAQMARNTLVIAQVALTTALLFGTGVLLHSSQNLLAEDVGFQRDHLLYVSLGGLVPARATPELRAARLTELIERVRALPGIAQAGLGSLVPFDKIAGTTYTPPGQEDAKEKPFAYDHWVDTGYFAALGLPILRGRNFDADDMRAKAPVAIVDETFVKRHFGEADPLGRHFKIDVGPGQQDREVMIVGVVPTAKQSSIDEVTDRVALYRPDATPPFATLLVRTTVAPSTLIAPLKALGAEIAPKESIGPIVAMNERVADTLRDRMRLNTLLGLLGATALLLAAVGLYAVLAYAVRLRMPEFGVRMALGASAARVQRTVLEQGLRLICTGLLLGAPLAWILAHALASRLYGVGPLDPLTLIIVTLLLATIGLAACWLPARQAAAVDPLVALRRE